MNARDFVRVLKFGGSSVGEPSAMRRAAMVAMAALSVDGRPGYGPGVVVVSALGGVTRTLVGVAELALESPADTPSAAALARVDAMEERHRAFLAECALDAAETDACGTELSDIFRGLRTVLEFVPAKGADEERAAFRDAVLATGELAASRLFCAILKSLGVQCHWMDAREFMVSDSRFGNARPDLQATAERVDRLLRPRLAGPSTLVVPGFIARAPDGRTTTMGFEASDLSATVIGSALGAREVQIWTDVSGVLSADPRVVPDPQPLPHLHYDSARQLALLGARVLHPNTMQPARARGTCVRVANSLRPGEGGTRIDGTEPLPGSGSVVAVRRDQQVLSVTVEPALGEATLAFLLELDRGSGPSDALFGLERQANAATVHVVSGDPVRVDRLAGAASTFGSVARHSDRATVSLIAADARRPMWPDGAGTPLAWQGLDRSIGVIVDDHDAGEQARTVHAAVHSPAQAAVPAALSESAALPEPAARPTGGIS